MFLLWFLPRRFLPRLTAPAFDRSFLPRPTVSSLLNRSLLPLTNPPIRDLRNEGRLLHEELPSRLGLRGDLTMTTIEGILFDAAFDFEQLRGRPSPTKEARERDAARRAQQAIVPLANKIKGIVGRIRVGTPLAQADAWIRDKHYTEERLRIDRLSGDPLPMDQCYINLAIVAQSGQDAGRPKEGDATTSPFSLFARQNVETPDKTAQVELATVFNQRKGRDGRVIQPRRILIRGRAGVGKTTLCKNIVREFSQGTWSEWSKLFDRVLWVPLRNLKLEERRRESGYDFARFFRDEYFTLPNNRPDLAGELSRALETKSSKTLFLLDGLDEVSQDLTGDGSMSRFLTELLKQPNVIITSRPSARPPPDLDLELETIGFYPNQVTEYLQKTFGRSKTNEIQSFLEKHWLLQSLVRIPIQLDALCYTWDDFDRRNVPDTMTGIYKAIEEKLWKKDVIRLGKKHDGELVTDFQIETVGVEDLISDEVYFLEGLAFTGLHNDVIDFTSEHRSAISKHFTSKELLLDKTLPRLSFLRTSDPSPKVQDREYHFIHLTFQEYFAARYFARQWKAREPLECLRLRSRRNVDPDPATDPATDPVKFLQTHKYTARYDILWRFVAGLLDADGQAGPFIHMIEEEPLDLLGPTHQRLVMHCLSEVSSDLPIRGDLEQRLSKWLLFECTFRYTANLASEAEFPELALDKAFYEGSEDTKRTILKSLTKRATIPQEILKAAAARLEHQHEDVRYAAVGALGSRSALPEETLKAVAARLEHQHEDVRYAAVEALGSRSVLPEEILKAVAARLEDQDEDQDEDIRRAAEAVLRRHTEFYRTLLNGPYVPSLYGILLQRSFNEQLSWYIDDGYSCVNMSEDTRRLSIHNQQNDVRAMIKKARPTDFPSISGRGGGIPHSARSP
ncbi:peptidase C14 [Ilyonectria robusta]